ncbi:MAG: hypothetical protein LC104_15105 [Bacteroidales bacterium]|nr:hypothetical protein [Bacteroidales bacterium]
MPIRCLPILGVFSVVAVLVSMAPAGETHTHRNGFAGRNPFWVKGEANIPFEEKLHKISDEHARNAPTSEQIRIESHPKPGSADSEFVHYDYAIPPAPVTPRLNAGLWVKAYRPGIQLRARLVLPKERDPKNPDAPLTSILVGETYKNVRYWEPLNLGNAPELLRKHLPVLTARLGRAVDPTDAYIDRLILNVYTGPGITELWVDDLEVSPVLPGAAPVPATSPDVPVGTTTSRPDDRPPPQVKSVRFVNEQIQIDGEPFFMLAVRHSDTPLKTLRDANLNTVWFPSDAEPEVIDEAVRQGFWIVPELPVRSVGWDGMQNPKPNTVSTENEATYLASHLRRFLSGDAVLMWNLGGGRTAEELPRVRRAVTALDEVRLRQPRAVDIWDGFGDYSRYVNAVGTHRWPLFTSLELSRYKDWLTQRKALTSPRNMSWTWVQTHVPEWYVSLNTGKAEVAQFDEPIGPHPEQIRILTYLSLAAGSRGLGYWSDRFLANSHFGRDRLLEIALLNTEIEMLKPVLFSASDPAKWQGTSNPNVQAAVIRGPKEILVLPVWLGSGSQYTPAQAALPNLKITVPLVPDAAIPWLVSPAGVTELKDWKRVAGGTQITIPEFDLTAAVVFTSDLKVDGKIVRWQDHTRYRVGELAAHWAQQQAVEQFNKALTTHQKIVAAGGPELPETGPLFASSRQLIERSKEFSANQQWDMAYREARRAMRPVRTLMRADWERAVQALDVPTASPYAVSFFSLPKHWELARTVATSTPRESVLPYGQFELSREAPKEGAAISSLPGWSTRQSVLKSDDVVATAGIVNSRKLEDPEPIKPPTLSNRYAPLRVSTQDADLVPRVQPNLGSHLLKLEIKPRRKFNSVGQPISPPQALERSFLAVDSPIVDLPPRTWVRIRFWAKIPEPIQASADGVVIYDSAIGEPLAVRLDVTGGWRQFSLYRQVPESGKLAMTFALTGIGKAYFEDIRIEPLAAGTSVASPVYTLSGAK